MKLFVPVLSMFIAVAIAFGVSSIRPASATVTSVNIDDPAVAATYGVGPLGAAVPVDVMFTFTIAAGDVHCSPYAATITIGPAALPLDQQSFTYTDLDVAGCATTLTKTETMTLPVGTVPGEYDIHVLVEEFEVGGGFAGEDTAVAVVVIAEPSIDPATVEATIADGGSLDVDKTVLIPLPPTVVTVAMASDCEEATGGVVTTSFSPASQDVEPGATVMFTETISVNATPDQQGQVYECDDWVVINGQVMTDAAGSPILEHKVITVPDTTPPVARCIETVNPHGQTVPPAGSTTLPGPRGGQNEDGFYQVLGTDNLDEDDVEVFVEDTESGVIFGPFPSGTNIKYTEANGATPNAKPIGSSNGQAGAVVVHITGNGDAAVYAVDAAGNVSERAACLVPPPPK